MEIQTQGLTRVYRLGSSKVTAVDDVDLLIEQSQFIAIVGRSGSGKSTLLNLIGLNDKPTSGRILIDGADISGFSDSKCRRIRLQRMGFVFQTFNLIPTLSAVENVELPLSLTGKGRKEQEERAISLLENVGVGNRIFHRPKQLSMGEMQRVSIARALANNPEIVIADEPTGELDSKTAKEIVTLLSDVNHKEKKTLIVATHDEKVVDKADVIHTMQDGKLKLEKKA